MTPPLHVSRRLMVEGKAYLDVIQEFGTPVAHWPLNDYATQSTTVDSIIEDVGGSLDDVDRWTGFSGTRITEAGTPPPSINRLYTTSSPARYYASGHSLSLGQTVITPAAYWCLAWAKRYTVSPGTPTSGYAEVINIGGAHTGAREDYSAGPTRTWGMYAGNIYGNISSTGLTDRTKTHLYVWCTKPTGGSNYSHRAYIAHPSGVYEIVNGTNTTYGFVGIVAALGGPSNTPVTITCNGEPSTGAACWLYSGIRIMSGDGPQNVADVTRIFNAGK